MPRIPAIVLAAGASSRMGSPKPLLSVEGEPALERVVRTLEEGGAAPVIVVLGCAAARVRAGTDLPGATVVEHDGWEAGRTSSIQAGLAALSDDAPAFVLALVDMPLVRAATVAELLRAWERAAVGTDAVVPLHDGRRGHPVVLGAGLMDAIRALGPDQPLRDVVRRAHVLAVDVDDPGVLLDLDTPEDLPDTVMPE